MKRSLAGSAGGGEPRPPAPGRPVACELRFRASGRSPPRGASWETACAPRLEGLEEPGRNPRPRPALDGDAATGRAEPFALGPREREQVAELRRKLLRVARRERDEPAKLLRILLLEPLRDLRQPRVARDERRATRGGGLGRHHAERLGEDRRHDDRVRERDQVNEMPVLERAREQRPRRRERLEPRAVVAEADDERPRVEPAHRLEQQVDALVVEELPEVEDDRLVVREEPLELARVALVREPLVAVVRVRGILPALVEQG